MVRVAQAEAAVDRLTQEGWSDLTDRRPEGELFRHRHDYYLMKSDHVGCDLHWNVGEHLLLGPLEDPTERFWSRAEGFELGGTPALALCPTDQLLHVILHGAQPGSASRLQWIADAVMILRGAEIEWARLEELAVRMRSTIRIADALSYLSDTFMIAEESRGSVERLRQRPVRPSERVEYALASGDVAIGGGMFPATFATYVRETRGWGLAKRAWMFPRYLQEVWELERLSHVPGTAARKAWSTLRARAPGTRA
jgi:hypothetical protein